MEGKLKVAGVCHPNIWEPEFKASLSYLVSSGSVLAKETVSKKNNKGVGERVGERERREGGGGRLGRWL